MTCPVCGEVAIDEEKDPSSSRDTPNVVCRYCRYTEIVDLDIGERDPSEVEEHSEH